jgi:hypothetical protein
MHITEAIRLHLGWCPAVKGQTHTEVIHPDLAVSTPSGSGSFKARASNWLGIFRNQLFILALYFSVVGVLLSAFLGGIDIPMFFIGIVAGSLLSVFHGTRFWKTMNEVRDCGAVFLATLYDKTTLALSLIVAMVPAAVFLGAVPGVNMTMLNSSIGGFIFILFWWFLLVTWIWESQTHRRLLSDGLMLSLAREASL